MTAAQLTPTVRFAFEFSSTKDSLGSFARRGGVTDCPGDAQGLAGRAVRMLDLRIDFGVKPGKAEADVAKT